jgi:hypothetical protein
MIYDAERRPREWARRTSGLGVNRSDVVYVEPSDLPRPLLGKPMWDIAPYLGKVMRASGADILFVDSILPAVGVGDERLKSDAQAPYLYVAALDELACPSVSFGHPPKGQPDGDPFGSVAWINAMRMTWVGSKAESAEHVIRWQPRKRNERGALAGVRLTVLYGADGRPIDVKREDDDASTRFWLLEKLDLMPRTVKSLAEELVYEMDDPPKGEQKRTEERLSRSMHRLHKEGLVRKAGKEGRAVVWGKGS